jgi:hypothetical protein
MALVVVYGAALACWATLRAPLTAAEAQTIFVGRRMMAAAVLSCGSQVTGNSLDALACGFPGSAALAPTSIALADALAGVMGARLLGFLQGIALIFLVRRIGSAAFHGSRGTLAAAIFVLLGFPLELSASAHARATGVLLLAVSLAAVEDALQRPADRQRPSLLLAGIALTLALLTTYVAAAFAVPLAVLVLVRLRFHPFDVRSSRPILFFLAPPVVAGALYGWLVVGPAWPTLRVAVPFLTAGWGALATGAAQVFSRLAMPYLLATIGLFHREGGRRALATMAVASGALLVPAFSWNPDQLDTAVLVSIVLLAPAAALGVAHMADLFSAGNPMRAAQPLFAALVLLVLAAFGIREAKQLRREQPDLSAAVAYLRGAGPAEKTVLVDSDYGSPEYVYRYFLDGAAPLSRIAAITRASEKERREALRSVRPDYVVLDDLHSDRSFQRARREYLAQGFSVASSWQAALASGIWNLTVLERTGSGSHRARLDTADGGWVRTGTER